MLFLLITLLLYVRLGNTSDYFIYPPAFGISGDYSANPTFTTGQVVDLTWESETGSIISLWLMQDVDKSPTYRFQALTNCQLIGSMLIDTSSVGVG